MRSVPAGLRCFGPSRAAAQLEGSKAFTKDFLARHRIPTAAYRNITDVNEALANVREKGAPIVIKADGLAAGKGVIVAMTLEEAEEAVRDMLSANAFGEAGHRVVIEEFLEGEEASFIVMVDGSIKFPVNPKTKSPISGEQYGGFRPQDCQQGSPGSAHKEGLAVDRFDPFGAIDDWLLADPEAQKSARQLGIYFEHPKYTFGWSHWTIRKPGSGNLFFKP